MMMNYYASEQEQAQTLAWMAYYQSQGLYSTVSESTCSSMTPMSVSSDSPVEALPTFDDVSDFASLDDIAVDMVGVSRGCTQEDEVVSCVSFEQLSLALAVYDCDIHSKVAEVAEQHAFVMATASLQEKRKLAKKFASLLQVNGISMTAFTTFEANDEFVRQQLNLILFKAGLNVQTVMSEHWEEVADVVNTNGDQLRSIMDHNKRLKNFFEVKFQEFAGAKSWDMSPKMGSPVAVRAAKQMQQEGGDKKQKQQALVAELALKMDRIQTFKKTLWAQFEQFVCIKETSFSECVVGGEILVNDALCSLMHPQNEEKRSELLTEFLENQEISTFILGFVELNKLVVESKKPKRA